MMNPEQRFLQSRQARLSSVAASSSRQNHAEELGVFWSSLRALLSEWNDKVAAGGDRQRQDWLNWKEELSHFRQHCLHGNGKLDLKVPAELPQADVRQLHAEFTKSSTLWETCFEQRFPKAKFIFARYRQELARRKALGIPLKNSNIMGGDTTKLQSDFFVTVSTDSKVQAKADLEHISDKTIRIGEDGSIKIRNTCSEKEEEFETVSQLSSDAMFVRGLENCYIQIGKQLEALHLVGIKDSTISVSLPIASSIHVTQCHRCRMAGSAQQLRIHESSHVHFRVELSAGAILEDSKAISFSGDVDVKDFNWLRTGVPSPNFHLEPIEIEPHDEAINEPTIMDFGRAPGVSKVSQDGGDSQPVDAYGKMEIEHDLKEERKRNEDSVGVTAETSAFGDDGGNKVDDDDEEEL